MGDPTPERMFAEISDAVERDEYEPPDCEIDFLDSIEEKLDRLTDKQLESLAAIWNKV